MDITDAMLQAAVRKAVEAGLLPRRACREDALESRELMRLVMQAALGAPAGDAHQAHTEPGAASCATLPRTAAIADTTEPACLPPACAQWHR